VSDYPSQYIKIVPSFVNIINKNQTKEFIIFIEVPKYFTKGKYVLNITVTGTSKGEITKSRLLTLYVYEVSREEAIEYLNQSQNILDEMKNSGLNVKKTLELVTKANQYFEEKNYEEVKKIYEEIKEISNYAFQAQSIIEEIEKEIVENEDKGLKVSSAKNLFSMSKVAFIRGDFVTALKRIEDCQNILSLETKGKINYMKLALDYWWIIVLGTTISSITGYFVHLRIEIYRTTDRLRNLRYEELSIMDKIRDIKEKTFKENLISMTDYHKAMYEYQKRLTEIKKEVTRLRTKRVGMKSIQTEIKNLEEEKKSIEKLIEETQISYFQNGDINKNVYDNKMNALTESLADLEKNIGVLKMKHENKG
jgi:tetratricopeptide (TPR) repeat protein